jgi:hypothetical protein
MQCNYGIFGNNYKCKKHGTHGNLYINDTIWCEDHKHDDDYPLDDFEIKRLEECWKKKKK